MRGSRSSDAIISRCYILMKAPPPLMFHRLGKGSVLVPSATEPRNGNDYSTILQRKSMRTVIKGEIRLIKIVGIADLKQFGTSKWEKSALNLDRIGLERAKPGNGGRGGREKIK